MSWDDELSWRTILDHYWEERPEPRPARMIVGEAVYEGMLEKWPEERETIERMFYVVRNGNEPVVGAPSLYDNKTPSEQ